MRNIRSVLGDTRTRNSFPDEIPREARLTVDELLALNNAIKDDNGDRWAQLIANACGFGFICARDYYKVDEIQRMTEAAMMAAERGNDGK